MDQEPRPLQGRSCGAPCADGVAVTRWWSLDDALLPHRRGEPESHRRGPGAPRTRAGAARVAFERGLVFRRERGHSDAGEYRVAALVRGAGATAPARLSRIRYGDRIRLRTRARIRVGAAGRRLEPYRCVRA